MSSEMSVARVLAKLEARAVAHQEQQAFHAQKEAHHRAQRELLKTWGGHRRRRPPRAIPGPFDIVVATRREASTAHR